MLKVLGVIFVLGVVQPTTIAEEIQSEDVFGTTSEPDSNSEADELFHKAPAEPPQKGVLRRADVDPGQEKGAMQVVLSTKGRGDSSGLTVIRCQEIVAQIKVVDGERVHSFQIDGPLHLVNRSTTLDAQSGDLKNGKLTLTGVTMQLDDGMMTSAEVVLDLNVLKLHVGDVADEVFTAPTKARPGTQIPTFKFGSEPASEVLPNPSGSKVLTPDPFFPSSTTKSEKHKGFIKGSLRSL